MGTGKWFQTESFSGMARFPTQAFREPSAKHTHKLTWDIQDQTQLDRSDDAIV